MIPLPEPQTHWPIGNSKESALFNARQMQSYAEACVDKKNESLRARVAELERLNDVFRHERDHARKQYEFVVKVLGGIHQLLNMPDMLLPDGRQIKFVNPFANETIDELSRRIRAIPDEINAIDAAMKEQKT